MVYKKYIIRGGKKFGPYLYESYRGDDGKVKTRYIHEEKNHLKVWPFFILVVLIVALIVGFVFQNQVIDVSKQVYSKVTGFSVEEGNADQAKSEVQEKQESKEESKTETKAETSDTKQEAKEEKQEQKEENKEAIIEEPPQTTTPESAIQQDSITSETTTTTPETESTIPEDTMTDTTPTTSTTPTQEETSNQSETTAEETFLEKVVIQNQTEPEQTEIIEENTNETIIEIINQTPIDLTIINETDINITETNETILDINETLLNETENTNITSNITTIITLKQYSAVIGKPVKWEKKVKISSENDTLTEQLDKIEFDLPYNAGNITIIKKDAETGEEKELNEGEEVVINNEKIIEEKENIVSLTGNAIKDNEDQEKNIDIIGFFKKIFASILSLTGRVIENLNNVESAIDGDNVTLEITESLTDKDEIIIEYYTEAPYSVEEITDNNTKEITIVGPENVHYENILAYTEIEDSDSGKIIKLYHITENGREEVNFSYSNNTVEWIVPHLSNQTYELDIIEITKAIHLDENRTLIGDIYEEVKEKDNIWSEKINNNEYVRITFETNLTNQNDITIYARTTENESANIEVYNKDSNDMIAIFENISGENWYKVYLANLTEGQSYDVFDLKIIGSLNNSVEFDYIVDPNSAPSVSSVILNSTDVTLNDTTQDLFANITASDPDNDNITIAYNWYKNGALNATTLITDGLVAYYPFDNDTLDYWGASDGVIIGETDLKIPGKVGNCYNFDTATYDAINISWTSSINFTGNDNFTYMAWFQNHDATTGRQYIMANRVSGNYFTFIRLESGTVSYYIKDSTTDFGGDSYAFSSVQVWHHVALVWTGSAGNLKGYFDGNLVVNVNVSNINTTVTGGPWSMGNSEVDAGRLNGFVDEAMIFNRSLADYEVEMIYYGGNWSGNTLNNGRTITGDNWTVGAMSADSLLWSNEVNSSSLGVLLDFAPNINITTPTNRSYSSNRTQLNYTFSDINLQACWYTTNQTQNATITCGNNITVLNSSEGSNKWIVWANDTHGNTNSSSVMFYVDSVYPQINITYPLNTTYNSSVDFFNITYSDNAAQACWYTTNQTHNSTFTCGNNVTGITSSEGNNTWIAWINDTSGNINSSIRRFIIDLSNSTNCFNATIENATYTFQNNMTTTGTCIYIKANNVTVDFNGYNITGDSSGTDYGIWSDGYNYTTIKNGKIYGFDGAGIGFSSTTEGIIKNMIINSSGEAIYFLSAVNTTIFNNNISSSSSDAIYLLTSSLNSNISNNYISSGLSGIYVNYSESDRILNNNITSYSSTAAGIYFYGDGITLSSNVIISNNNITSSGNNGIALSGPSENNTISGNNILCTNGFGISLYQGSKNDVIARNTIYNVTLSWSKNINIANPKITNNLTILDQTIGTYRISYASNITFRNSTYGEIKFIDITATGDNLFPGDIILANNSAYVNSSSQPGLNKSANITFYNLKTNFIKPRILRDGLECNASTDSPCYNFTSLNAGTVVFNVSSWSNYSINDSDIISPNIIIKHPGELTYNTEVLEFNISSNEALSSCIFTINNWITNNTMTRYNSTYYNYTKSSLGNENYRAKFWCNDTAGNVNNTEAINFTVYVAPISGCTANCSCASNTCLGSSCSNGCGGTCQGTLEPVCPPDSSVLCGFNITSTNLCGKCSGKGTLCSIGNICVNNTCEKIGNCSSNSDCNDNNLCTNDKCLLGECSYQNKICSNGMSCNNTNGNCEEITNGTSGFTGNNCVSDFSCGEWSECVPDYDISLLIYGINVEGRRTRLCVDSNKCNFSFFENDKCSTQESIILRKSNWCNENYTEILNKDNEIVSRFKTEKETGKLIRLDININDKGDCYYCHDKVMNYDETGVDCGGSCVSCDDQKLKYKKSIYYYILMFLIILLFLLALILLIFFHRTLSDMIKDIFKSKKDGKMRLSLLSLKKLIFK